ncbi:hypothetical protein CHS0354_025503 [Potamilus streckersoni]|uniref:Uncharacterized protein n=1 Tax=Potamilus streckersoni TaxID=2493646 RepID=A0AAE0SKG5_9BIVA|nr:hypothetical protein CHS0354_025503 [Potamilus streckersoni]
MGTTPPHTLSYHAQQGINHKGNVENVAFILIFQLIYLLALMQMKASTVDHDSSCKKTVAEATIESSMKAGYVAIRHKNSQHGTCDPLYVSVKQVPELDGVSLCS